MEEADEFIKEACKHLECSFADEDDIEFSSPQIFEFLVRCIWKIDSSSKTVIPSFVYPKVITARLHLGNAISTYLQKLHIRGDTALHTVLYGNINNLRSAFIELIRKLPADATENAFHEKGYQFLADAVKVLESQPECVPVYCRGLTTKQQWSAPDNEPEIFPLTLYDKPSEQFDPRKWISQYINSTHKEQHVSQSTPKPMLPPKPVFIQKQKQSDGTPVEVLEEAENEEQEKEREMAALQKKYDEKLAEYKDFQKQREEIEKKSLDLQEKLSEFDPELIEALQNPAVYAEQLLGKIADLNKQMEEDTMEIENRKLEAAKKKLEMTEEMRRLGLHDEDLRRVEKMEVILEGIDERIEGNLQLASKLKKRIEKSDDRQSYTLIDYGNHSKELDEMVRKQEQDMLKMQDERHTLRKQEERESEALNRSFAIIYNILLQHCDQYRGRLAMESFTRIHLYCMEIMEMLRENGALKQAVGCLQAEVDEEQEKQYDKQFELLNQDFQEISDLNEKLFSQIKMRNPNFQLPKL